MALGRITVPRLALAFVLVAALCGLQSQVLAATGSLASEINALFELHKAGGLSTAQYSAATDALIASASQGDHETRGRPPKLPPPPPRPRPPTGSCRARAHRCHRPPARAPTFWACSKGSTRRMRGSTR